MIVGRYFYWKVFPSGSSFTFVANTIPPSCWLFESKSCKTTTTQMDVVMTVTKNCHLRDVGFQFEHPTIRGLITFATSSFMDIYTYSVVDNLADSHLYDDSAGMTRAQKTTACESE